MALSLFMSLLLESVGPLSAIGHQHGVQSRWDSCMFPEGNGRGAERRHAMCTGRSRCVIPPFVADEGMVERETRVIRSVFTSERHWVPAFAGMTATKGFVGMTTT